MRDQPENRLRSLRQELEKGQTELDKVGRQQSQLRDTPLRISGAIQVLEEVLAEPQSVEQNEQTWSTVGDKPVTRNDERHTAPLADESTFR